MQECGGKQALDFPSLQLKERIWSLSYCRCLMPAVRLKPMRRRGPLGMTSVHGRWGLGLGKAMVQIRTDKIENSCLTLGELVFLCHLSYHFFSIASSNSVSAGNSDAKDAYWGWLKSVARCSVAAGPSPALRALEWDGSCRLHHSATASATRQAASCSEDRPPDAEKIPPVSHSQQFADPSAWVKSGMVFHIILLIPWRFAKRHEKCGVFTAAICYKHVRLLVLVTSGSAEEWDFSACPIRSGSNHCTELRSRGSSQITSRCSLQARKYRPHAGGSSNYHTWPDLAQVLYEMFEWEAAATTSPSSLCGSFSGDVTQAPPSTGRRAQPKLRAAIVAAVATHAHCFEACICASGSGCQTWASSERGGKDGLRTCSLSCMDEKGQGPGWWKRR